jgi:hypothetical protein
MNRSKEKGGRQSARKAHRVVRSKPNTEKPSVLSSARREIVTVHHDLTNSIVEWRLIDDYEAALRDALHFYDRAAGNLRTDCGYTAADVLRLEEIRKLVQP